MFTEIHCADIFSKTYILIFIDAMFSSKITEDNTRLTRCLTESSADVKKNEADLYMPIIKSSLLLHSLKHKGQRHI